MNSKNSKTTDAHRLMLDLIFKLDLQRDNSHEGLSNLSIYYTWKNGKRLYRNNEFKISGGTYNEECELPNGSYSISDIQDYFEYIIKKHETITDEPPVQVYVNKIQNWVTFKIKNFGVMA